MCRGRKIGAEFGVLLTEKKGPLSTKALYEMHNYLFITFSRRGDELDFQKNQRVEKKDGAIA